MVVRPEPKPFDPNEGESILRLPVPSSDLPDGQDVQVFTAEQYVALFERRMAQSETEATPLQRVDALNRSALPAGVNQHYEVAKATGGKMPPSAAVYGRISYMPDPQSYGVIEWPGIQPAAIKKIVKENLAPQLIIGLRCADVLRYSDLSRHSWRPGWQVGPLTSDRASDDSERKDIREAEQFLLNSCMDLGIGDARERDKQHLTDFQRFLDAGTRDAMTYAAIALWTDLDAQGRVKRYALLPAGNIRLTGQVTSDGKFHVGGYLGNPDIFAVLVDEAKVVLQAFTRDELTFFVRNPRTDIDIYGYPYSEVEIAIRLIQGYQNSLDMNCDTFVKSAIPNGILVFKGGQVTQKQLDLLNRLWTNLKKGVTKSWALPVIGLNADSEIEVIDLSRMKGNEAYYEQFINMLAGALCVVWKFPVHRIGYRISGKGKDTNPPPDSATDLTDADDPGRAPLLLWIENLINQYLIWPRWPHLRFWFNGRDPKEDARAYQAKRDSMTYNEARAESNQPPIEDTISDPDLKKIAALIGICPIDPNIGGTFASIAAAATKAWFGDEGKDAEVRQSQMPHGTDPARKQDHGHVAGVRRDSAAESK